MYCYMVNCDSMRNKRFHGINLGLAVGKLAQIFTGRKEHWQ